MPTFGCFAAPLSFAALLLSVASSSRAAETSVKSGDVPPAVTAALAKTFPHARVSHWSKETEHGQTTYEASVAEGPSKRDAVFAEDGSLLDIEQAIAIADLPAQVNHAVAVSYPHASIRKAEKILHGSEVRYEVDLAHASRHELLISSNGKILEK